MKKPVLLLFIFVLFFLLATQARAKGLEAYDNSIEEIKNSVSEDARENMKRLGVGDVDITSLSDISLHDLLSLTGDMIASSASEPFASCAVLVAVILLASLLESYAFSLRYVDTADVMNVVTSLMIITAIVTPIMRLIQTSCDTVRGTASMMLIFIPVMIAIMAFGGHIVRSGGYYATVMAASQAISQLSSSFFIPLLNIFMAFSVSSAISERVKLNGICNLISKLIKWTLAFAMSLFTAVLSIQGMAADAVDSVASKTVRFALSSFIPIVGSAVSEAYKSIEGSVALLRSGIGIFVIIAVAVTYLPLIIQILLWQLSILAAKTVAETFGIKSAFTVLASVSSVLSVLCALIISMTAVFLISSGVLLSIGGAS